MGLRDKLFTNLPIGSRQEKQAVIICLQFPIGKLQQEKVLNAIFELDAILQEIIETTGVGTYHGPVVSKSLDEENVKFFISGADASRIYHEIKPILQLLLSLPGSSIIKQYSSLDESNFSVSS